MTKPVDVSGIRSFPLTSFINIINTKKFQQNTVKIDTERSHFVFQENISKSYRTSKIRQLFGRMT